MPDDDSPDPTSSEVSIDRRRFLAVTGSVVSAGVAGCSGILQQEFEAQPVKLPETARGTLVLDQVLDEPVTVRRAVDAVDGEVKSPVTSRPTVAGPPAARQH